MSNGILSLLTTRIKVLQREQVCLVWRAITSTELCMSTIVVMLFETHELMSWEINVLYN